MNRFPLLEIQKLQSLLEVPQRIVITTHHKPDGDAIGSSLALWNYLLKKGQQVSVVTPTDYPDFFRWMPGEAEIVDFGNYKQTQEATRLLNEATLIFCLDFNATHRVEKMQNVLANTKATKVLIDHHLDPENFCSFVFSYPDASSTSELVYGFIEAMGDKHLLNKDIASCIYTGIMTDTASFRFSTMKAATHRIIADLIDAGAENYKIHEAVFDDFSESRLRFLGFCIKDKLVVLPQYSAAYIAVSKEELLHYSNQTGDTEGVVNFALSLRGIKLAVFFAERKEIVKISFRSKGNFSVQDMASKYFEGGGHKNASGGKSLLTLQETVDRFVNLLPTYKDELKAITA